MRDTPLLIESPAKGLEAHITVRRGDIHPGVRPKPRINRDGKFKIMQASDLHLATGLGVCRDAMPVGSPCEADSRTLEFVSRLLDSEKPDLIVLSGDQINGDTAPDVASAILKLADLFIKRGIPYAAIFGNHDDEKTPLSRSGSMSILESLPYSLSLAGPGTLSGVGNYVVEVLAAGTSTHAALSLYLLDSHTYSPDEKTFPGYGWVKEDQIEWFKTTSKQMKQKHSTYAKIHMSMAFVHIPLPEYADKLNEIRGGEWREGVTAPKYNSGFKRALVEEGVLAVGCGHDHANDYCAMSREKIGGTEVDFDITAHDAEKSGETGDEVQIYGRNELWMCYAGGAGFGGYGGYGGYHRRIRFWEIDANSARITTYKRLEWAETKEELNKRIDEIVVVEGGKVVAA
jgi:hypothetical protein